MILYSLGELALVGEDIPKESEESISGGTDILINIFNLLIDTRDNQSKVIIVLSHSEFLSIKRPDFDV